ncbi:septum formation inhibitor Maf [Rhodococcus hoagii]|nr:septum formation inhibitor Maf [Prescottella equi]
MTHLVLASASPSRLSRAAGRRVEPTVRVSVVDEDADHRPAWGLLPPRSRRHHARRAKARDVIPAPECRGHHRCRRHRLRFDAAHRRRTAGKPHTVDVARERWAFDGRPRRRDTPDRAQRACACRTRGRRDASDHSGTVVHFASPSAEDPRPILASGEPLKVAGAFTPPDSLGGWFVERLNASPSSVNRIGLPLVRRRLSDVRCIDRRLWAATPWCADPLR